MMTETPKLTLIEHFSELEDPRKEDKIQHKLIDILVITICASICGADDWVSVESFGRARIDWFKTQLELPNGIPSHDTFGRVFSLLHPQYLQDSFISWTRSVVRQLDGVVAFDGKRLRRSHNKNSAKNPITMVSAWTHNNRLTL